MLPSSCFPPFALACRVLRAAAVATLVSGIAFGQSYNINTLAGGWLPNGIPATSADLGSVAGVALDGAGNVFFTWPTYSIVLRRDAVTGVLTVIAGNGAPGFSGDNGPATSALLNNPYGVALDSAGNLYIADFENYCVRKVSNGVITTVAGDGTYGFDGDNGPATSAQLAAPLGVAVDSAGNLYIADRDNNRVRKVSDGVITTVAGNGTSGYSGDNGPATSAELSAPNGVALDSAGDLYIADTSNSRIRKVSNGVITTVAGNGTSGFSGDNGPAANAELDNPIEVAMDYAGNLYIADFADSRIRMVSNGVITTVAGGGTAGLGDNGPATSAELAAPYGVAVDSAGNLYIADFGNDRIRKVSNGVITTVAGDGASGFGDGGPATSAELLSPNATALDSAGNVYIADTYDFRVRKVSNGIITTVVGNGTWGFSGDDGPAVNAELSNFEGIAVDSAGNFYVADTSNCRIREVSNGVITTVAGNGTAGFSGDNGPATSAELGGPSGITVDSSGNLYIADFGNNRIRKVSNGVITTVAGNGTEGYGGDNGPATSAELSLPSGVAVDSAGNLYIADYLNNRIRKVSNGVITTVAGNGTSGFSGDNGPATSAELYVPGAVAVDSAGNLYIADTFNNRIRKVSNGLITTIAGNGTAGFSGDDGQAMSAELDHPYGVAVDSAGNVFVGDTENNRIRLLQPVAAVPPSLSVSKTHSGNFTQPEKRRPA